MKMIKRLFLSIVAVFAVVFSLVSCTQDDGVAAELESAAKKVVLTQDKQTVTGSFEVPGMVNNNNTKYSVAWVSNNDVAVVGEKTEASSFITISVDYYSNTDKDESVTLTATISKEGSDKTLQKTFIFTVPKFNLSTIAQYDAADSKADVTVAGIIVAKEEYGESYKNTSVYLASPDGIGGIYAYRLACTQEQYDSELLIGKKIYVSGPKMLYSGLREFDGGCTYILDPAAAVTPTVDDLTTKITSGTEISADYQCHLGKFTNLEIISIGTKDSKGRYNIVVGDAENDKKQFTLRINTYLTATDSAAYTAYEALDLTPGTVISAEGVIGWNNTAQLYPMDADDIVVVSRNAAKVFASALADGVTVPASVYGVKEFTLPTLLADTELTGEDYANFTASWTSNSTNAVIAEDGKKVTTALVKKAEDVTLTLTIKNGENTVATAKVTFSLVDQYIFDTHESYEKAAVGTSITIKGVINGITQKNAYLEASDGSFYLYALTQDDLDNWCKLGNEVVVTGKIAIYNNLLEVVEVQFLEKTGENKTYAPTDITSQIAASTEAAPYTITPATQGKFVTVTGTYGISGSNKLIKCGDGSAIVYFQKITAPDYLVDGQAVTIKGYLGVYKDASQIYIISLEDISLPAADKVAAVKASLAGAFSTSEYSANSTVTLKSDFNDVTFTAAPAATATTLAYDETKKAVTITPTAALVEDQITFTITCGTVTDTVTVTIKSKFNDAKKSATISFTALTENYNTEATCDATKFGLDASVFTVTASKGSSSGVPVCNAGYDEIRLYKAADGGSFTVSVDTAKYNITSIEVTFSDGYEAGSQVLAGTTAVTGTEGVYAINAASFTIKNTNPDAQVRVKSIVISYTAK